MRTIPLQARDKQLALVCAYPPGRGTLSEYASHLAPAMAQKVERLTVLAEVVDKPVLSPSKLPGQGVLRRSIWRFNSILAAPKIALAARRYGRDGVIFNMQFASFGDRLVPAALGLFAPLLCRLLSLPVHVILHNIPDAVDLEAAGYGSSRVRRWAIGFFSRTMMRLILASGSTAVTLPSYVRLIKQRYGAERVSHVPHGSFYTLPSPKPLPTSGPIRILTFGKFGTYKIVDTLLDAFWGLQQDNPKRDLELIIAGTDNPNARGYLARTEARLHDRKGVRFTGYVPEEAVAELFESASMVVFDYAATTGSSGVLNQVGAFARPAVLPDIGDLGELLRCEGYQGVLFRPRHAESLKAAMQRLIDAPDEAAAIGEANYQATLQHGMDAIADRHLALLETRAIPAARQPSQQEAPAL